MRNAIVPILMPEDGSEITQNNIQQIINSTLENVSARLNEEEIFYDYKILNIQDKDFVKLVQCLAKNIRHQVLYLILIDIKEPRIDYIIAETKFIN